MKMKILLTILFVILVLIRLLIKLGIVESLLIYTISIILFLVVTRDKANSFRVSVCMISIIPEIPIYLTPIPYITSVLMNDEWLRKVYRWRFIVFTGIDGSGKTTHSRDTMKWITQLALSYVRDTVRPARRQLEEVMDEFFSNLKKTLNSEINRGKKEIQEKTRKLLEKYIYYFKTE